MREAKEPFRFFTRLSLTAATGEKARDIRELREGIAKAPDAVLYTHTYRFLQQMSYESPEPANDFSIWVTEALQEEALGERLAAVDPIRHATIAEARAAVLAVLDKHLARHPSGPVAPRGREFHFLRSVRFSLPTPLEARDLASFHEMLGKISHSSLYLHLFEARLRPPLGANDFSLWLEGELGEGELAKKIARLDPYSHTYEALRTLLQAMVAERLGGPPHG